MGKLELHANTKSNIKRAVNEAAEGLAREFSFGDYETMRVTISIFKTKDDSKHQATTNVRLIKEDVYDQTETIEVDV